MGLGKNLSELIDKKNTNPNELASSIGVSAQTIYSMIKRDSKKADIEVLIKIASALNVSVDTLLDYDCSISSKQGHLSILQEKYDKLEPLWQQAVNGLIETGLKANEKQQAPAVAEAEENKYVNVVYFEDKVSAGDGWDFIDGRKRLLTLVLNETTRKADYAVKVKGDSMLPMFQNGDVLLVREQPDINEGEIGIFVAAQKAYVKKKGPDRLISINEGYPDVKIPDGEVALCKGKVIGPLKSEWVIED